MKKDNKIYYISYLDNWGSGINQKINMHIKYFKNHGYKVEYITLSKRISKLKKYLYKLIPFLSEYEYKKLNFSNNIVYIRYGKMDFQGLMALKKLKKNNNKIFMEIPTYPYDKEVNGIWKIFSYKDKIIRKFISKYVEYIFTYSDDKKIFGVKTINISNFVDTESISKIDNSVKNNSINLIAVASLAFWHGYDRLIKGLYDYYKDKKNNEIIKLHIVGSGSELKKYKRLIGKFSLNQYVILDGIKTGKELDKIYNISDIAIDSLGRHRAGVSYNSTLKGKEYLAKGLPIVSGVKTELDFDKSFLYYLRVPADDSNINIQNIIDFYYSIYSTKDKNFVHNEINNYAKKNFNVEKCMEPIIEIIKDMEIK